MIDVDPDDLKGAKCDFPALFYVDPDDYRPHRYLNVHVQVSSLGLRVQLRLCSSKAKMDSPLFFQRSIKSWMVSLELMQILY